MVIEQKGPIAWRSKSNVLWLTYFAVLSLISFENFFVYATAFNGPRSEPLLQKFWKLIGGIVSGVKECRYQELIISILELSRFLKGLSVAKLRPKDRTVFWRHKEQVCCEVLLYP